MMVGHQTRHPWRAPTVPVFGPSRPIRPTAWGLLPINALGSGRWVVRRRSPHHSREVPIPERSGTAFRKGPGLARPIRSVPFRLQNLGCPGLRARGSLGPIPRALSGLLAPGAGASQHTGASAATAATTLRRLFLWFCFSRRSPETRCRCCRGRPPVLLRVLVGSVAALAIAQAKTAEWPSASTA
jgi:hypothetical protein